MKIIASTGMPGAGKELVSDVAREFGIEVVRMGDVVREKMRELGLEINNRSLREFADNLRKKKGKAAVAKLTVEYIRKKGLKDVVFVDGVRSWEEVKAFKEAFGDDFHLIAVFAPRKIRYQRLLSRKREDDMTSFEEFVWREEKELSWGLGSAIAMADYIIVNDSTIEKAKEEARKIIRKILEE